jgi:hypothetical protein
VVRHLLRQLLEKDDHLPEDVLSLYEKSTKAKSELTAKQWIDTFCKLVSSSAQVYILLDGFDECPDRLGVNRFFRDLKHTTAKCYVAARAPIDLEVDFHGNSEIEVLASKADLETYIQLRLEENEDLDGLLTDSLRAEVVATLIGYANGVKVFHSTHPEYH